MRPSLMLLIISPCIVAPAVWAQTTAPQAAATQQIATGPAAAEPAGTNVTHAARRAHTRHARSPSATGKVKGRAPAGKADGVLALGATDITGNKELPKVMVIVPWKDSTGAGGVIKPTDSLMDEVLEPVDRGVFQRRIRYYGELNAAGGGAPVNTVAPVGDSH